ncbi:lysozyme inhibitor LprI family protein [Cetobacterium somerae]
MKFGFKIFIFMFFIISLFNVSLGSVTEEYSNTFILLEKQYEKNMAEDYSITGMVIATNDYYDELDKVLNKVYKELMATLTPDEKIALRDSQRAWIKFREKEVAFSADLYSKKEGTIYRLFTPANRISLMKNRIMDLIDYLSAQKDEL